MEIDISIKSHILVYACLAISVVSMLTFYEQANAQDFEAATAEEWLDFAWSQPYSSIQLEILIQGYEQYPKDSRFVDGINNRANSLLNWAARQDARTAIDRAEIVLAAPVLSNATQNKAYDLLYTTALNYNASSQRLEASILFFEKYEDSRFVEAINESVLSLFTWAMGKHHKNDFNTAINRYEKILDAPRVYSETRSIVGKALEIAKEKENVLLKIVNAEVQNYTYSQMTRDIQILKAMYPDLIKTRVIGQSLDGRNIHAIKLGSGRNEVFINGSHHAREHMTTNVAMKMLNDYAYAYAKGNYYDGFNVRTVLNRTSIWFVPMVNPDGVELVQRGPNAINNRQLRNQAISINRGSTNFDNWKANVRGVDLNRQYPAQWDTIRNNTERPSESHYKGPRPLSEPEVKAVYDFSLSRDFKTALSYHSSGEIIFTKHPDHVADIVSIQTGYPIIDLTRDTSGGGYSDWFVLNQGKPGLTLEISPPVGSIPVPVSNWDRVWRQNDSVGLIVADEAYRNRNKR